MATLEGKNVLVTGGAGFVGSHIVDLLVEEGCRKVTVIDNMVRGRPENLARAATSGAVELVEGDIRDHATMERLVSEADIVFHQAALRITHCAAEPRQALEVMVDASFNLFTLCVEHGVEKVVAASSASIYGMAEAFPTDETHHPYDNRTLYGAAKLFNEGLLRSFHDMYGLNYVALRYFNVYGPRMDIHGKYTEVLIRWMERIAEGQPPIIFGNGSQAMDMVHVTDVARANLLAAKNTASDAVFNIGSGSEISLAELAGRLAAVMGKTGLEPEFAPERKINPVPRRQAGTDNAKRLLGFETLVDVDAGLRALVAWWGHERRSVLAGAGGEAIR